MDSNNVLLAVLAHPDDESFGIGGTLAVYARRGAQVHLVCATRGEAGDVDPQYLQGFKSIADRRVSELRCAAGVLGLTGVYFLDYRDSGMSGSADNRRPEALANAPQEEVSGKIVSHMRRLRPQVVVTFDPIGGYLHPDHIAIHRATVQAFHLAGQADYRDPQGLTPFQPQKLYYHVLPKQMLRWAVRLMPLLGRDPRKFGHNQDIDLVRLVEQGDFPTHAWIDFRSVSEQRDAAAACHASQFSGEPPRRSPLSWVWRWTGQREQFMRAYPEARNGVREKDLFAGIL
ncbi:MAG: PIG-L family deacetylase [Anaerolineae bacterium]|nr:PIG-L family deacetylase [Anaerolineae bacterium]MCZ7551845.1 PIG-L family deacetylase [Anaerolineales bacterium]